MKLFEFFFGSPDDETGLPLPIKRVVLVVLYAAVLAILIGRYLIPALT